MPPPVSPGDGVAAVEAPAPSSTRTGGKKKRAAAAAARASQGRCTACTRQPILLWIFIVWLATFVVLTFKLDQFRSVWSGEEPNVLPIRVGGGASSASTSSTGRRNGQLVRDEQGNLRLRPSGTAAATAAAAGARRGGDEDVETFDGVEVSAVRDADTETDVDVRAGDRRRGGGGGGDGGGDPTRPRPRPAEMAEEEPGVVLGPQDDDGVAFVVMSTNVATAAAAATAANTQLTAQTASTALNNAEDSASRSAVAAAAAAAIAQARSAVQTNPPTPPPVTRQVPANAANGGGGGGAPTDSTAANPNRGWRGFLPANRISNTQLLYPELLPPEGVSASALMSDVGPLNLPVLMHLRNRADGRCMDVDVENSRHVIRTMDCTAGRRRQQWDITYRNEIQSVHYSELCLALTSDSASFYPAPCSLAMQTQHWEITPTGLLRSMRRADLCLGTHVGASISVSDVVVMPCTAAANSTEHQWSLVPSGEPILTVFARLEAVRTPLLPAALTRIAGALDRQQVLNRTEFVFLLPEGMELPPAFAPLTDRGWRFRIVPRAPAPGGSHPALGAAVQTTVQVGNMTLVLGGRYVALLDHPASLEATGPYYITNAIWSLLLNPIANVAVHGTPEPLAPTDAYQQGCLCLRSLAIPFANYQTLTPLLASSAFPIMHLKLWREAGGVRPVVGQTMWPDCGILSFWLTADAIVGIQLTLVPAVGALNVKPDRPHLPVNFPRSFDECPIPPDLDVVLPEELDGTAPSVTGVAIVTRSWVILTTPELFPEDEIIQAMCSLLQVEPAAVLGSPHFLLIKQLAPISAHQRFIDGLRVEGTGGRDVALRIYTGLTTNKNYVGIAQAQPWIYRYRAELLETIGDVEMTEDVCIAPLTPSRGPDYDERLATSLTHKLDALVSDGVLLYHYVWTRRDSTMFSAVEFLSIESVFKNDPSAMVIIHSDLVDETDIAPWAERKLKIMVVPLNFIRWATDNYWFAFTVDQLQALYGNGPFWYAHKVDLWRMWILERFGGVYLDTDVILQKPINRKTLGPNVLGLESGSLQVEKSHEPVVVNTAVTALERSSAFAQRCMRLIGRRYRSSIWSSVGPRLVTSAILRSGVHVQSDSFMSPEIRVLSTTAFYPVHWRKTALQQFYEKRISEMAWSNMRAKNTAMHFWSRLAGSYNMVQDSLAQRVLRSNCDICAVASFQGLVASARAAQATQPPTPVTEIPTEDLAAKAQAAAEAAAAAAAAEQAAQSAQAERAAAAAVAAEQAAAPADGGLGGGGGQLDLGMQGDFGGQQDPAIGLDPSKLGLQDEAEAVLEGGGAAAAAAGAGGGNEDGMVMNALLDRQLAGGDVEIDGG